MFSFNLHYPRVEETEHGWKSNSIQSKNAIPHFNESTYQCISFTISRQNSHISIHYLLKKFNVMIQRLIGVMGGHILFIVGLALVGKDIVFRFIIEYNSLRDFGP
jgi:hypothetical protein